MASQTSIKTTLPPAGTRDFHRLFDLPREIRTIIYKECLTIRRNIQIRSIGKTDSSAHLGNDSRSLKRFDIAACVADESYLNINLLFTSRLIYKEAAPVLYGYNIFRFYFDNGDFTYSRFLKRLTDLSRSSVRFLEFIRTTSMLDESVWLSMAQLKTLPKLNYSDLPCPKDVPNEWEDPQQANGRESTKFIAMSFLGGKSLIRIDVPIKGSVWKYLSELKTHPKFAHTAFPSRENVEHGIDEPGFGDLNGKANLIAICFRSGRVSPRVEVRRIPGYSLVWRRESPRPEKSYADALTGSPARSNDSQGVRSIFRGEPLSSDQHEHSDDELYFSDCETFSENGIWSAE